MECNIDFLTKQSVSEMKSFFKKILVKLLNILCYMKGENEKYFIQKTRNT